MADDTRREPSVDPPSARAARHAAPASAGQTARAVDPAACAAVVDRLPIGVVVYGAKDQVVSVNPAARRLLHLDDTARNGRLLPRPWPGAIHDEGGAVVDPSTWPLSAADAGDAEPRRFRVRHPAHRIELWLCVAAERLPEADDGPGATVVTLLDHTALKAAQNELGAVVADRAAILGAVPDTFVYVAPDDRVTDVAGAPHGGPFGRRLARARVIGKRSWELFEGEAVEKARQAVALARTTGRPVTTELTYRSTAGPRCEETRHVPLADGRLLVTLRDVSARKEAEEALQLSEAKYRTLYAHTPVMLHSIDGEGRLISVSDRWLERLGYTASEVLGRRSTEFLTEASQRLAGEKVLPEFFRTGQCADVPYQLVAKSGEVVEVLLSATAEMDTTGRVTRSLAVLIDVSAQRAAELEVTRQEEALHAVVDQAPLVLWTLDTDMTVTSVRGGASSSLGLEPADAAGRPLASIPSARSALLPAAHAALSGTPAEYEHEAGDRVFAGRVQPLRAADGTILGAVGVSHDVTERRAAEAELNARQEQLRLAVDQAPTVMWTVDETLRFTSSRGGGLESLGLTTDQVVGLTLQEYFASDDGDHPALRGHQRALQGHAGSFEMEAAGHLFATRVEPLRDAEGAVVGVVGVANDVTATRAAQDSLRDREEMLSGLVGSLPGAAYRSVLGAPWRTSFISDGCLEVTGYTAEELTGGDTTWAQVIHPDDLPAVIADLEGDLAAERGSTVSEYRVIHKDGTERWLLDRAVFVRDEQGSPSELIGLVIDISDRRAVEQALRERDAQLGGLLANIPGMAYRCQAEPPWQDEFIGAACLEMTGYTPEQLIAGRPVWELIMEEEDRPRLLQETQEAIAARRSGETEYRIRTASGELRWIWDRFHVIRDDQDRPVALDGLMLDVTARHSAEEESQRLRLHDVTTGLPNRFLFTDRIAQALTHAARRRFGFAVAAVAVDRFSTLADTLGHEACDRLLVAVADRLTESVRTEDTVACLAGSEFGMLLPGVGGPSQASTTLTQVTDAFAAPFQVDGHELFLTLSIGIAIYPNDGAGAQDLLERAEVAARRVSSEGGNAWEFFRRGMNDEHVGRLALEGELHRALQREQFVVHFQPVVDARSGAIVGAEALLRWQRPGTAS